MYDLPGGILLYVRVLRKNLSLEEFYSMPEFLGGILIWIRVLCRNLIIIGVLVMSLKSMMYSIYCIGYDFSRQLVL